MAEAANSPKDFARAVQRHVLQEAGVRILLRIITELSDAMFAASLKTEEGQSIRIHVSYVNPKNPDPSPPVSPARDRWSCVPLAKPISANVPNLVKLAKASDPRSSCIAVYQIQGKLMVWGLIDQGNSPYNFLRYESDSGYTHPGTFQVSIVGAGHLVASRELVAIAELRINRLVTTNTNAIWEGPVGDALNRTTGKLVRSIEGDLKELRRFPRSAQSRLAQYLVKATVCRLLLRTQDYRHGGAFIITPRATDERNLAAKYAVSYSRLKDALAACILHRCRDYDVRPAVTQLLDANPESVPIDTYLDEWMAQEDVRQSRKEVDNTLWFVSLLSRVDGAVVMNNELDVVGFGVEILTKRVPQNIYLAGDAEGTERRRRRLDYNHLGTRHRSVMRYCNAVPGSIGFVVSQDGDIRVVRKVGQSLMVWENLRLQIQSFKSEDAVTTTKTRTEVGSNGV